MKVSRGRFRNSRNDDARPGGCSEQYCKITTANGTFFATRRQARAARRPTTVRNCPREHVDANSRKAYFHASSGLSGDTPEQRGFSKVRVFVQPLSSEQLFASADETKNSATNPSGARVDSWRYFSQKNDPGSYRPEKETGQTNARKA